MNNKSKVKAWIDKAEYDIITAKAMLDTGRDNYVAFTVQQALEKILKAFYVKRFNKIPIKSHNLIYLSKKVSIIYIDKDTSKLFKELSSYYVRIRYATDFNINREKAQSLYDEGVVVFQWLKEYVLMK